MKKLFTPFILVLISLYSFAQVPSYLPTTSLVGWWPFNGNANDGSGYGNNGTVSGATLTFDRFGNNNSAYSFNGINNFIEIAHSNTLAFSSKKQSVSFWMKMPSIPRPVVLGAVMSKCANLANPLQGFVLHFAGNSSLFYSIKNGNGFSWGDCSVDSVIFSPSNRFYHIVYTNNLDSIKCYVNGILKNAIKVPTGTEIGTNNNPLVFGKESDMSIGIDYFKGVLDDIGIWSRALSAQEVKNLYNANVCYQNVKVTDTLVINTVITNYNPITYQNTIKVYPNPTKDHLTIDYGNYSSLAGFRIKIINSQGQVQFSSIINQAQNYVSLSSWTGNGLYFLQLLDAQNNLLEVKKIVLE